VDPATLGRVEEGRLMSAVELLMFATAVQWSAGVVVVINVVMSRLEQAEAQRIGGR
jgi:hypothetical protein